MPAFRVVDTFPDHPKLERLADRPYVHALAVAAWTLLGADCLKPDRRTDGRVSFSRLKRVLPWPVGMVKSAAKALVECGLWTQSGDDYVYHDWADYQATSDQISADRKATANRQKRWRQQKNLARNGSDSNGVTDGNSNGVTHPVTDGVSNGVSHTPLRARALVQVPVKVQITLTTFVCSAHTCGVPPLPKTADPEALLRAVCDGIEKRLSARQAPAASWNQTTLTQVCAIACWLADTQGSNVLAALDQLLDMWFADAWVASQGFPLGSLANHPGKYFAGRTEPREAIRQQANEALSRRDLDTYRALMKKLDALKGGDDD